jgi:hypothetical protein
MSALGRTRVYANVSYSAGEREWQVSSKAIGSAKAAVSPLLTFFATAEAPAMQRKRA